MKLLKSPLNLIAGTGTLVTLFIIVLYIAGVISFPNKAVKILTFALFGGISGILACTVECDIRSRKGLCFEGRILNINEVYIGIKIGGSKCCRFGYSYVNNSGEIIKGTSRIVYLNKDYFLYVKNLSETELNQRFKIKIYVEKDNPDNYISEVYKKE